MEVEEYTAGRQRPVPRIRVHPRVRVAHHRTSAPALSDIRSSALPLKLHHQVQQTFGVAEDGDAGCSII